MKCNVQPTLSLSVFFKDDLFFFFRQTEGDRGVTDTEMITNDQSIHLSKDI